MSLDAACVEALALELDARLRGMRVDKVQQPERDLILLSLRGNGESVKLLLCLNPGAARVHITEESYEQPLKPPMFCMLLRKHLQGARVASVIQPNGDRILILTLDHRDELGDLSEKRLVAELMGRNSNLALLDAEGHIIDCLRRVGAEQNPVRPLLPGLIYQLPPKPENLSFPGISFEVRNNASGSLSSLLDAHYTVRERALRAQNRSRELTKTVKTLKNRAERKLAGRLEDLRQTESRDTLRKYGDLITANLYRMSKGKNSLAAQDYYDPDCAEIIIPLDPLKTPQQNAAKYYKDYNRQKSAENVLRNLIETAQRELSYLDSVLASLSLAESERDISNIRAELEQSGFLKSKAGQKREKATASQPLRFVSGSGLEILVGRSNTQNDLLLKSARRGDLWFHAQKIHGSHVILRCAEAEPDAESLSESAALAAHYSQARDGGKVPVDYTQVRYVKKPPGALPGMVTYNNQRTILAGGNVQHNKKQGDNT